MQSISSPLGSPIDANRFRTLDAEFARDGPVLRRRRMRIQTVTGASDVAILLAQLPAEAVGDVLVAYRQLRRDVLRDEAAAIHHAAWSFARATNSPFNPAESQKAYDRMIARLGPDPVEATLLDHLNSIPEAPGAPPIATILLRRLLADPVERRIVELGIEGTVACVGQSAAMGGNGPMVDRLRDLLSLAANRGSVSLADLVDRLLDTAEASLPAGIAPADLDDARFAAEALVEAGFRGLPPSETVLARRIIVVVLTRAALSASLQVHHQTPGAAVVAPSPPQVPQRHGVVERRLDAWLNQSRNGQSPTEWLGITENALMRARLYGMTWDWGPGKLLPSPLSHAGHALALWRGATAGAALERDRVQHLAHTTIAQSRNQLEQAVLDTYGAILRELDTLRRQVTEQWSAAIEAEVTLFRQAARALQSGSVATEQGSHLPPGAQP